MMRNVPVLSRRVFLRAGLAVPLLAAAGLGQIDASSVALIVSFVFLILQLLFVWDG